MIESIVVIERLGEDDEIEPKSNYNNIKAGESQGNKNIITENQKAHHKSYLTIKLGESKGDM